MAIEHLMESEAKARFDDYLNETNEVVKILGGTYEVSELLKETDPIAYEVHFADWVDAQSKDGEFTVENYHEPITDEEE